MTTSVPFLVFPGVAGNFIETADTNLLDADTAHVVQSQGLWTEPRFNFTLDGSPTADSSAPFGGSSFGGVTSGVGTANTYLRIPFGTSAIPVSVGQEYAASFGIKAEFATTRTFRLVIWWLDSGGGFLSQDNGVSMALSQGVWTTLTNVGTAPASAVYASIGWEMEGGASVPDGSRVMLSAASWRTGSDAGFVPSLRIVGDLDMRLDIASSDWTPSGVQEVMSRWGLSGGVNAYMYRLESGGTVALIVNVGGTQVASSTVATGLPDGTRGLLRVTRVASSGTVTHYLNGATLGSTVATPAGAIDAGVAPVVVSGQATGFNPWGGSLWSAEVRDGIDGPVVARCDASDAATATVT